MYGQLLVATPAGIGAVELGLAGGIAGSLGADTTRILLAWRLYGPVVPVVLGLGLGARRYRPDALRWMWRSRDARG